ncbi:MAG: cytochrome c oxidase subunit 4 [Ilumatobacteraceae bacterium]
MRIETLLWTGVTVFYLVIGALYTAISDDPVGSSILLIASGFGGLMAGWTWDWGRRHGPRPEDLPDATTADALGPVGVYPTASLRPFVLAIGVTALAAGIPLGSWMSMGGIAIIMSQVFLLVHDLDT